MGIKLFGEILLEKQICTEDEVAEALSFQKEIGGKIGTVLLNSGVISEAQLLDTLSTQLEVPLYASLERDDFSTVELEEIPNSFLNL